MDHYLNQCRLALVEMQATQRPIDRPQSIRFDLSLAQMEHVPTASMPQFQRHLGKPRLTLMQFTDHRKVAQFSLVVLTNHALDLANMLNGDWLKSRSETLSFGQLTRVMDAAYWVNQIMTQSFDGTFGDPTIVEGSFFDNTDLSTKSGEMLGVLSFPFEIPKLCSGYLLACLHSRPVDLFDWTSSQSSIHDSVAS